MLKPGANESQKTLNKCETRNKTVLHTRLRHPEGYSTVFMLGAMLFPVLRGYY